MESTQDTESQFIKDVEALEAKQKEAARQVRDGYTRLGLEMPPEIDNTRTMSVTERLGLK